MRKNDCRDSFKADSKFFPLTICSIQKKHDDREPKFFKPEFRYTEMLCVYSKNYCCYDNKTDKFKFSSKGLNKRVLEDYGSMSKNMTILNGAVNLTSTNIGSRTVTLMDATYEQTKKGLSNFYPRRQVQDDWIQTKPLKLWELSQCRKKL